jgi:hypothetical protein
MTNEEMDRINELILKDPYGEGLKVYARLSPEEREQLDVRIQQVSREGVEQVIRKAEANGTMDRIRELHALDQAKKKAKKRKLF